MQCREFVRKCRFFTVKVYGIFGSRLSRRDPCHYVTKEAEIRLVKQRLEGNDPYWWILAGGIHVPGFAGAPDGAATEGVKDRPLAPITPIPGLWSAGDGSRGVA